MRRSARLLLAFGLTLAGGLPASAQIAASRSEADRLRVEAVEVREPLRLDGVLDDEVWQRARPVTGFVQAEPREGQAATERTEVRVAFDGRNLYIGAYLYDTDPDALVVNDIKKDFSETGQDAFSVILDTFHDRRNGYVFMTNPEGARGDQQVANEGREINASWDAVWNVRSRRVADGWVTEMSIPFTALRFDEGVDRPWGINFSRRIRRKNELAYWSPVPRSFTLTRLSLAGDLLGLPQASGGRDLRVKPYVLGATARATGVEEYGTRREAGVDVKAGVLNAFTLDLTVNPDFAQVEADVQQVNLTQFSQFFPEKREFFLENSGLFYLGDAVRNNRTFAVPTPDEDLLLFFSRRVGVADDGRAIPITAGGRLTGRVGNTNIGAIMMRTDAVDGVLGSDYGVVRLRQNVGAGSDIGAIFMNRSARGETGADDYNRVYGADANIRFPGNIDWNTYVVGTETPGVSDGQYAWRTSVNREANYVHIKFGAMELGENFNDDLGFYRRTGMRKYFVDFGVRPRPESFQRHGVREMHPHIVWNYYEDLDGVILGKNLHSGYTFFMNDGGFWELSVNPKFERIASSFRISPDVDAIAAGSYGWAEYQLRGNSDPSKVLSGGFTGIVGGLWSGTQKTVNLDMTIRPSYKFFLETRLQRTNGDLDVPDGVFTKTFWTFRSNYSFNTNMFVDALVQYDPGSEKINSNIRFNLIHHPLSDLFIVFNEQRFNTGEPIPPGRSFTIKATQMVAF
ncbi:MAG TPA: DUF5916 domain-containing protein [Longimicrobiales bacterium]|nr:DUF5916 domain-containing protein [Longimicrobiales bacterium]